MVVRLTRMQAIVSLFQALGGGWVLPDDLQVTADACGGRRRDRTRDLEMKLKRILPILVGLAVVAGVGGYVMMGKQEQQQQKQKRARTFPDQPAPVLAARRRRPTCRSISTRSATRAR